VRREISESGVAEGVVAAIQQIRREPHRHVIKNEGNVGWELIPVEVVEEAAGEDAAGPDWIAAGFSPPPFAVPVPVKSPDAIETMMIMFMMARFEI